MKPGDVIIRRYLRGSTRTWEQPMLVLRDDEDGLLLWHPAGSDLGRLIDADGRTLHDVPLDRMRDPAMVVTTWAGDGVLVLMPPDAAYSVWWFFAGGAFDGWYVNLEKPSTRRPGAVETTDHVLDIVVTAQREWAWKDEDEFAAMTGHPLYFDRSGADEIRAEGVRLTKLIEAGEFPFDGTHTGFRPDPSWGPLRL